MGKHFNSLEKTRINFFQSEKYRLHFMAGVSPLSACHSITELAKKTLLAVAHINI